MGNDTHISAGDFLPEVLTISSLRQAARGCEGCSLFRRATQTVFGEGPDKARIIMIGEQPGDTEDLKGSPFVGSAGKLLDRALKDAAIDRSEVYVTNAVKHFKWVRQKADSQEAQRGGDQRLPAVARGGDCSHSAGSAGVSGRDCRAISDGPRLSGDGGAREIL
jgi:DNA polymerase